MALLQQVQVWGGVAQLQQVQGGRGVLLSYNKYSFGEVWLNYSKYRVGEGGVLLSNNKYIFGEVRLNYSKYRMGEVRLSYKRKNKKNDRNGFQKNILIQSSYSPVLSFCFPSEVDKGNMKVRKK